MIELLSCCGTSPPVFLLPGSDCYDPEVSSDGRFVAMRCTKKAHADGSIAADDEAWLYSRDANTVTLLTDFAGLECNRGSPLKELYQEYWLAKGRNFIWEVREITRGFSDEWGWGG